MKHEDKVMRDILKGVEPEKKVQIGYSGKKNEEESKQEKERKEKLSKILMMARRPWFCPECGKVMKTKVDDKMWTYRGKCGDCAIQEDTMMRIKGGYSEFEKERIQKNQIAYLKDVKQSLEDALRRLKNPEYVFETGEFEKWSGGNLDELKAEMLKDIERIDDFLKEVDDEAHTNGNETDK